MRLVRFSNVAVVMLMCALAAVSSASAGDDDPIKLGPIIGYPTAAEAAPHCVGDGVIWADRKTGFIYPRFMEQYGKTANGTYTCYKQARDADYWGFGSIDTMGMKGKSFPIFTCPSCS